MFASVINVINVKEGQKKGKRYNYQKKGEVYIYRKKLRHADPQVKCQNMWMYMFKALIVFLVLFPFNLCLSSRKSIRTIMSKV